MATAHDLLFRKRYRIPSARRVGWDYRWSAAYFVTICTLDRDPCLGEVQEARVLLSAYGEVVAREWRRIPGNHPHVILDSWVVMPDHLHGILWLQGYPSPEQEQALTLPAGSLGAVLGQFKSKATKYVRARGHSKFNWQERFHDRILRDADELQRARLYIQENPARWSAARAKKSKP